MLNPSGSNIAPWSWLPSRRDLAGLHHPIDALARIGTVADDVAQAKNLGDPLRLDVVEHHFQGFEVPMNITDQSTAHRGEPPTGSGPAPRGQRLTLYPTSISTTLGATGILILAPRNKIGRSRPDGQVHDVMVSIHKLYYLYTDTMNLLVLDTSTDRAAIGLASRSGAIVSATTEPRGATDATSFPGWRHMLAEAGLKAPGRRSHSRWAWGRVRIPGCGWD